MENEKSTPDDREVPDEKVNPIKKREDESLKDSDEVLPEDLIEQSHELDPHKAEEDPTTFLPFGGE